MLTFIAEPFYQLFLFFFKYFKDPGIAIIIFALFIRIALSPLYFIIHKEEDKLKKIQAKIKNDTSKAPKDKKGKVDFLKQAEIASRIYQEEKFNPFKNFIVQMSPLPILFAMLAVFNKLKNMPNSLIFLGFINLKTPNAVLAILTLILQLFSLKNQPPETRKTAYFLMGVVGIVLLSVPAMFIVYWIVTLVWTILERKIFCWYEVKFRVKPISENNTQGS